MRRFPSRDPMRPKTKGCKCRFASYRIWRELFFAFKTTTTIIIGGMAIASLTAKPMENAKLNFDWPLDLLRSETVKVLCKQ